MFSVGERARVTEEGRGRELRDFCKISLSIALELSVGADGLCCTWGLGVKVGIWPLGFETPRPPPDRAELGVYFANSHLFLLSIKCSFRVNIPSVKFYH